ncbi:response regulator receiver protein [Candidatus Rickettsiella viridis]|uniref:Response regulator receiver protein n=1 Tax=Candidatus Rickettsiella viridis TaxID=676208 RepID=A0A2Z5UUM8_9COXI|nr:response regulator [Candidatus Rickettsiella viridis]BBB15259.1 response regulator receiver protein [Candidatus Rickettsiella viridis]
MNILIVEDNRILQKVLSIFFNRYLNIKPLIKENGQIALDFIKQNKNKKIDLIFTDLRMPEMDGIEFCKELRKTDKLTPIILMTAQYEKFLALEYEGVNEILMKPFKLDFLANIISRYGNPIDYPIP